MKKIIAITGSNSSKSINATIVNYAANQLENIEIIDLTTYDIPMYSADLEASNGIPAGVTQLVAHISKADSLLIATPEHNSLMPAFFKNILDWLSRTGVKYLENKSVLVLSVAPGTGGGGAINAVSNILSYAGAVNIKTFNFTRYFDNFDQTNNSISNSELDTEFKQFLTGL